ncbi:MAG: hypothetical protein HF962_05445 [Sulfurovum sp.]|nr:hypothetical protein [Sulfurovum sp.]
MTTLLYLLIAVLIFFVIGYLINTIICSSDTDRYLQETPKDPVTEDDGSYEDKDIVRDEAELLKNTNEDVITIEQNTKDSTLAEDSEYSGVAPEGLLDTPRDGKKDNLTRIKGVGVKIEEALNAIGIWHFDQISTWTEENIQWADKELAFPGRVKRDDWVGQAKLLAQGKETEFSKRVDKGEVASSKKD